jgi:hypothetical protein
VWRAGARQLGEPDDVTIREAGSIGLLLWQSPLEIKEAATSHFFQNGATVYLENKNRLEYIFVN